MLGVNDQLPPPQSLANQADPGFRPATPPPIYTNAPQAFGRPFNHPSSLPLAGGGEQPRHPATGQFQPKQ